MVQALERVHVGGIVERVVRARIDLTHAQQSLQLEPSRDRPAESEMGQELVPEVHGIAIDHLPRAIGRSVELPVRHPQGQIHPRPRVRHEAGSSVEHRAREAIVEREDPFGGFATQRGRVPVSLPSTQYVRGPPGPVHQHVSRLRERGRLHGSTQAGTAPTHPSNDMNHPRHGVRAVQCAARAADYLDPLHVVQGERGEVEAAPCAVHLHPVDQHQRVIALPSPHEERRHGSEGPVPHDVHPPDVPQGLGDRCDPSGP